jgi:uncharacterized membrane protein
VTFRSFATAGVVLVIAAAMIEWYSPTYAAMFVALVLLVLALRNPTVLQQIAALIDRSYQGTTQQERR